MHIVGNGKKAHTYDAIVVGSGISGGWAGMELCKKGLKTLLLDRGRNVEHIVDYPTATLDPWNLKYRGNVSAEYRNRNPVQCAIEDRTALHFFADDESPPYIQDSPFFWFRGNQVGGRSLTWGRQCYRWSDLDFEANLRDGVAVDWPIRYRDLAPWYDYVESFIGVSGERKSLPHLPDGDFLPPMELNCMEQHLARSLAEQYDDRLLMIARVANLTKGWNGRGPCLNRNLCARGCPYGGYFSSNSATIPAAFATGNLTLRPHSIVAEIIYDDSLGRAVGVRVIDAISHDVLEFYAKIIFVNASTIATASILLQSRSARFPNGLGNDSEQVGHNLMDHHSSAGASGVFDGLKDMYYKGRRPCGFIIPRYRNLQSPGESTDFIRGYNIQGVGERRGWEGNASSLTGFGEQFKESVLTPGPWAVWMAGWGECLPYHDNQITLDAYKKDKWGLPVVKINFSFRDNEHKMMTDISNSCAEMLENAGFSGVNGFNYIRPGGATVHEMGTVRMGRSPQTSVLNGFNQMHSVKNVFITDGSCMTSSACQNPSLTYMALTARACDRAYGELRKGNI